MLAPASAAFFLQEPRHTHTATGPEAYGIRCCFSAISLVLAFVGNLAAALSVLALAWPVQLFSNLPVASSIHCLSLPRSSLPHLSPEHNLNKSAVNRRHEEAFDWSHSYTLTPLTSECYQEEVLVQRGNCVGTGGEHANRNANSSAAVLLWKVLCKSQKCSDCGYTVNLHTIQVMSKYLDANAASHVVSIHPFFDGRRRFNRRNMSTKHTKL